MGVKLPFFSSTKNFLKIGSIPAVVLAIFDVLPVGATAIKYPFLIPYFITSLFNSCHLESV